MTPPDAWLRDLVADVRISILFSTRLPLPHPTPVDGARLARATWALPLAGALIGVFGALAYGLAHALRLPPLAAAALALAATVATTGCLHEDGLADTADGFGGGGTREHKLEIMRDSRIGSYGATALALSLLLRFAALASLADAWSAAAALVAAHASARAVLPAFMRAVPPARRDGLSADAGRPTPASAAVAALLGAAALAFGLAPAAALIGLVVLAAAAAAMGCLSLRQIGGQTGDVIGALEQVGEAAILLVAAARL